MHAVGQAHNDLTCKKLPVEVSTTCSLETSITIDIISLLSDLVLHANNTPPDYN